MMLGFLQNADLGIPVFIKARILQFEQLFSRRGVGTGTFFLEQ